ALDSKTGQHVLEILRDLYRGGTTVLLITHDENIAANAKRVVRLSDGKIISDQLQEVDWE
ncbi:MAG: macrolide ABC transporter ATP-binding protein, partial [Oscillibacter sp.]|nr:macrolide ABC transporter ATP-binding protein [Oscillibacter sp.]